MHGPHEEAKESNRRYGSPAQPRSQNGLGGVMGDDSGTGDIDTELDVKGFTGSNCPVDTPTPLKQVRRD